MYRRSVIAALAAAFLVTSTSAEDADYSGTYLCQSDRIAGAQFERLQWDVFVAQNDTRWLFKFERQKDVYGQETFNVSAKHSTWDDLQECTVVPPGWNDANHLEAMGAPSFSCTFLTILFTVNLEHLTFVKASTDLAGLIGDLQAGRCSKID